MVENNQIIIDQLTMLPYILFIGYWLICALIGLGLYINMIKCDGKADDTLGLYIFIFIIMVVLSPISIPITIGVAVNTFLSKK